MQATYVYENAKKPLTTPDTSQNTERNHQNF